MQAALSKAAPSHQPPSATARATRIGMPVTIQLGAAKRANLTESIAENWARRAMHRNGFGDGGF